MYVALMAHATVVGVHTTPVGGRDGAHSARNGFFFTLLKLLPYKLSVNISFSPVEEALPCLLPNCAEMPSLFGMAMSCILFSFD